MNRGWTYATRGARGTIVSLMFAGVLATACEHLAVGVEGPTRPVRSTLTVTVENRSATTLRLSVLRNGVVEPVGLVPGHARASFEIGALLRTGTTDPVRLRASEYLEERSVSGESTLELGDVWISPYLDVTHIEDVRLIVGGDLSWSNLEIGAPYCSSRA